MKHLIPALFLSLLLTACGSPLRDEVDISPQKKKDYTLVSPDGQESCLDFSGTYRLSCEGETKLPSIVTIEQTDCRPLALNESSLALTPGSIRSFGTEFYKDGKDMKGQLHLVDAQGGTTSCSLTLVLHAKEKRTLD